MSSEVDDRSAAHSTIPQQPFVLVVIFPHTIQVFASIFRLRRSNLSVSGHVQFCQYSMSQFSHGYKCAFFLRILRFLRADDILFTSGLLLTQFFSHNSLPRCLPGRKGASPKLHKLKTTLSTPL